MLTENQRRLFLKGATTVPILGGAILAMHTILRYFKPTMAGGLNATMAPPDEAGSADQIVADLSDLKNPWDFKDFIYVRTSVEYSARKTQGAKIPGFVVVQRICPHLGCTFNFITNPSELAGGYNYKPPEPVHPYFACPCHLSVYDPTRKQDNNSGLLLRGKVVSGPAPRPPRYMKFNIKDGQIVITDTEGGGVG